MSVKKYDFEPSPKQYVLWESLANDKDNLILGGGAAGGGKSFVGCMWLATSALRYPNTRWVLGRKVLKVLKESTLNTLLDILDNKLKVPYHFNQISLTITFNNGSIILLKELALKPSDPRFETLGGLEITGAFIDEVSEISEKAIDVLFSRIRWKLTENRLVPKMFLSTNPTTNWVRSRFVQDDEGSPVACANGERFIKFTVYDNPDEEFKKIYVKSLKSIKDPSERERLLFGNWDFVENNDAAFYSSFDGATHIKTKLYDEVFDKELPIHLSFDFNRMPYVSCLMAQIDVEKKNIYFLDEILGKPPKGNKSKKLAERIAKKYAGHSGGCFVYGDPNGKKESTASEEGVNDFTQIMKGLSRLRPKKRLDITTANVKSRGDWINDIFELELDGWTISIDLYKCRNFINDLQGTVADENGGKDKAMVTDPKTKVRYQKFGHLTDCMDYFLVKVLRKYYKKHKNGGKKSSVHSRPRVNSHAY